MIREGFGELAQIRQAVAAVVEATGEEGVGAPAISQGHGDGLVVIREGLGEPIQLPQDRAAIVQGRREEANKVLPPALLLDEMGANADGLLERRERSSGLPRSLRAVP